MNRNVNIIEDLDGNQIVLINDILFKSKRNVNWNDVEAYLKQYVGEFFTIAATNEIVYIGADLPDEYTHSNYTRILKGANAKAKADARFGWYRYESRLALPVYGKSGELERYNVFHVAMLFRHNKDGKMYLYDIMNIKKETSKLFRSSDLTQ